MRDESGAIERFARRCRRALGCVLFASVVLMPAACWAQSSTFVVTGADRVFVRRGPGTEFPPFVTLTKGSTVEVQEMRGEWARIVTTSGQSGYVNSTFLALPGEHDKQSAVATAQPSPGARVPTPTPGAAARLSEPAALRAATERNKTLEAQVHSLQQELTALKSRAEATVAPILTPAPAPASLEQLQTDITRLSTAVETLQRRLELQTLPELTPPSGGAASDSSSHPFSPGAVLLGMLGVLGGWMLGSSYGRKQERGRRSRIRF